MRRLIVLVLAISAAAAAALALGAALGAGPAPAGVAQTAAAAGAHPHAAASPLAGLDKRFRKVLPSAKCAAAATKAKAAKRLRAKALKGAEKASPKVLKRKKASLRRAIAQIKAAAELCEPPPGADPGVGGSPPAPGGAPGPGPSAGPAPTPPPPGTTTISLTGTNFAFSPSTPVTVKVGVLRLELTNGATGTDHRVGVRTLPGQALIPPQSPVADPGGSTSVEVTLAAAGAYQIFCDVSDHAAQGMVVPLTVTP